MYKNSLVIVLSLFLTAISGGQELFSQESQEEEFFIDLEEAEHGGFGAFVMKTSNIAGKSGLLIGGRGGWIINHNFVIGAGAYALVSGLREADTTDPVTGLNPKLFFTQVGLELEYIFHPKKLFHYSFMVHVGAGNLTYALIQTDNNDDWDNSYNPDYGSDWFFLVEPSVNAEINVTKWFRISAGLSYRLTKNVEYIFEDMDKQKIYESDDVNGITGTINFKFGAF